MTRAKRNLWERSDRGGLVVKPDSVERLEELAYEQAVQENPMDPGADALEWSERVKARAAEIVAERERPGEWWAR